VVEALRYNPKLAGSRADEMIDIARIEVFTAVTVTLGISSQRASVASYS
jgi:hypothetical protein